MNNWVDTMTNGSSPKCVIRLISVVSLLLIPPAAVAQGPTDTQHAKGTFDVKLTPLADEKAGSHSLGRISINKKFQGELDATSTGEMLTAMTSVKDSAGYVATERVTGTLNGRTGSFLLLHRGIMTKGAQDLTITVVPDSGTDQLAGLAGTVSIVIKDGKHYYDMEYTLPD